MREGGGDAGITRRSFLLGAGACVGGLALGRLVLLAGESRGAGGLTHVETRDHVVALTLDDGPDPRYTPAILDALRRRGVHATFFVVGANVVAHRDLVGAELAAGHTLANHTYDHVVFDGMTTDDIVAEIARTTDALVDAGAPRPAFFRPPRGVSGHADVARIAAAQGLRTVFWDAALEHYLRHHDPRDAVDDLLGRIAPGSIILAHDGGHVAVPHAPVLDRSRTVAALPRLLDGLDARGYEVVDLAALLARARTVRP